MLRQGGGVAVAPNPNYDPNVEPTLKNLSTSCKYAGGMVRVQSGRITAAGRELDMTSAYDFVFGSDAPQDEVYAMVAPSVNSVLRPGSAPKQTSTSPDGLTAPDGGSNQPLPVRDSTAPDGST